MTRRLLLFWVVALAVSGWLVYSLLAWLAELTLRGLA